MIGVSGLGFGGAAIGNLYHRVDDEEAAATVDAAWRCGVRYFDTAPHYGIGLRETRLGQALRGRPRDAFVVSTKVGRRLVPYPDGPRGSDLAHGFDVPATHQRVWDFSADGVRRSLDSSLDRLALDRVDLALLHDPEESPDPDRALTEAYPALDQLRREGVVRAIGVGSKDAATLTRFAAESDVDTVMVAGRYTLLDQRALPRLLPLCQARGIAVINVGVFNSGLLAVDWPDQHRTYEYTAVPPDRLRQARAIATVCRRHRTTLPHAALAFARSHPAVVSVVVGADAPSQVEAAARVAEPGAAGRALARLVALGLIGPDLPVPIGPMRTFPAGQDPGRREVRRSGTMIRDRVSARRGVGDRYRRDEALGGLDRRARRRPRLPGGPDAGGPRRRRPRCPGSHCASSSTTRCGSGPTSCSASGSARPDRSTPAGAPSVRSTFRPGATSRCGTR